MPTLPRSILNEVAFCPHGVARLLGAYDVPTFLRDDLGERMRHLAGPKDQWASLFSWRNLSTLLNEGFATPPRLRLLRNGTEVDPTLYTHENSQAPNADKCQALMAEGATLILQGVENATPALEALVRELTHDLCGYVHVDVVATTAGVPGLRMHRDNAECFNLQLDGEKIWRVIKPERMYPLTATERFPQRKDVIKCQPPDVSPTWTGTVKPGDMIYVPRGWWHAVSPHVSPSLHLSVAVDLPTMSDYMEWMAKESTRQDSMRRVLPAWEPASNRRRELCDRLSAVIAMLSPESVEVYLEHLATEHSAQRHFALPDAAAPEGPRLTASTRVRLHSARPLHWNVRDGFVSFDWEGRSFRFDGRLRPAFEKLCDLGSHAIADLGDDSIRVIVTALVLSLRAAGILAVVSE